MILSENTVYGTLNQMLVIQQYESSITLKSSLCKFVQERCFENDQKVC